MKPNSQKNGQALILVAFAAMGLFALAALAIDGSRVFSDRRHAQNAADTSVLAAALTQIRTGSFSAAELEAKKRAATNGYTDNGGTILVDVDRCDNTSDTDPITGAVIPDTPCKGVSGAASEYIRVRIISTIPTTFARVIGRGSVTSAVEAVARVQGSSSTSSFPDQAVVALKKDECAICTVGNGSLEVHNSGVFSNSTGADCSAHNGSMDFWTNVDPWSEMGFIIPAPGIPCLRGTTTLGTVGGVPSGGFGTGPQIDPHYNVPEPGVTCTGPALPESGGVVYAGWHDSLVTLASGDWTFEAGNHCFRNGLNSNANNVVADNVNFLIEGGQLRVAGRDFYCQNMLVFGAGGSGMYFGGAGNIECSEVTFYMKSGDVSWAGSADIKLRARTSGDYQGLLIHLPESNPSPLTLTGTAGSELIGSIIAPASTVRLGGNDRASGFDTQIVGYKIELDGNAATVIRYNPANQYSPPDSPTIQLTE